MLRLRPLAIVGCIVVALCLLGLWGARSQTGGLRRATNTTEEGININPSLSGDGRRISFESTEDIAHAGGNDHFRAIRADITSDPAAFTQLSGTRAPAPGISQDGSRIAFAAKEDPLGTNTDGNSEIFLYDGATLRQITNTTPGDISRRTLDGNFQPSLTDDGRFIAFSSNRNLTNQNADGNLEIFIFDTTSNTFTQLTNTTGQVGASDAKISGDSARVAYIRDSNTSPGTRRDLILQDRSGGTTRLVASSVTNLAFTYGRAISDDGSRIVYSADIATDSSQVFLFDGRTANSTRQITALGVRTTEVPLHPTISGDGSRIAFATRRPIAGISNTDNSIEVYTFDIPTGQFARVTNAPSNADGFDGSSRVAEVVSSLNDDGSVVAFNFPRSLSGAVTSGLENNSEIYVTGTAARPTTGSLTVLNEASFGHEPSTTKAIAPDSNAVALGGALAFTTQQAPKDNNTFPTTFGGTTVTVNGRRAQITFVSPTQVNFIVPQQTEVGTAEVVVTNEEGFQSRGTVAVLRAAPGIFTKSGDGQGEGVVLNANMQGSGTFDPSDGQLRLIIFTTGVRHATQVTATAGGRALTVESFTASPDMPGMDEVRVLVPADLRGAGTVNLVVRADNRDSNPVTIIFAGNACRDIVINEVLADPPDGSNGDANHDGARDSNDDEFVELVNTTANNIDISGYQLLTRSTSASNDTLRHTFAPGTIFPAGSAIVVFGGGSFNPTNPVFGGAQVFKTSSSGGLSLTNSGGVVTLREPSQSIVSIFSYGGSTGLNGDANQSLTRSPDAGTNADCGNFTLHSTAPGSDGRLFSPGTRVNGSPFASGLGRLTSVTISPPSSSVTVGQTTQFTAQARDQFNRPLTNVTITFASDNTNVATVDGVTMDAGTGIATATVIGRSQGTAHITAQATDGATTVTSSQATLPVNPLPAVVTRVEVSPPNATINRGQTQQFTATAFDQNNQPIAGATFAWNSSDPNVATINSSGLASGVGVGSVTITATTPDATGAMVSGTATLNVQVPLVINEVNADVAVDNALTPAIEGDSNRDGVRDSDDDEFIELLNNSNASVDISGVIIADATSNRFTIPANTTLAAGRALVIFGGGTPNANDPAFGGALVLAVPGSGTFSLNDTGDTVNVKLNFGGTDHPIASVTYGGTGNPAAPSDQSLTRSPDAELGTTGGSFVAHNTATNAAGRTFSPGTRADGTPFGSPAITRIEVSPASATIDVGATQAFTARAFSNTGGPEIEVQNVSFIWDSSDTSKATVAPTTGASTVAKAVASGNNIIIRARAGAQQGNATLTVNAPPTTNTYSVSGQVKDASNNPLSGVLITFDMDSGGTLSTKTTLTDANGNYSSGDLGCQNRVKVTPSKAGLTFTPSAIAFVTSSGCLSGSNVANFTGATPPPGTLVISQLYVGGGNASATYTNDFVEIFNSGTTTVDFSQTPYSIQYVGTTGMFGSTSTANKTNITAGTIAPGQYFLVQEASGGAVGVALPTADATGSINMAAAGGKVALVVGTAALPASTCPGDNGASPFNPLNSSIADFVGYGSNANTTGHCYEGPGPAAAPSSTNADFRKGGGCVDTDFNGDDFLVAAANPRNTSSPLNDCSAGIKPEITINDPAAVSESAANASFTVTLSTPSTLTVTVDYATSNGTATAGADYQSTSGTLTFAPGETTKSIPVPVINDTLDEPSETFFVNLTNASNAVILDNQGQGTITDNDAAPTISINDTTVIEGDSGTTNATFNVTLSAASGFTVTVNYATADGTATAGTDYQSTSGTLTFNPGQTTQTILVPVNGDTTFESNETFFVNLTTPTNATILDNQGQGTITNDDAAPPVPAITINDVSVAEGNSGTKTVDFTVTLSTSSTQTVTVAYATANGTATAPSDYLSTSGTLTFNPGDTSKSITITINGDTLVEPDETFFVNLSNASANAIISDNQGQGTITNDDAANLVISQVYGGGNNSGASYQRDFIEIFNRGTTTVDFSLTNYSVQYASAGANFGSSKTDLTSGTIAPGHYFLIQESGGTTNGAALPTPDVTGTIAMGNTSGKVALVAGTAFLPAAICPGDDGIAPFNPNDATIADFIGYGSVSCYEGAGPASAPSNTTADFRKAGGCLDTNDNAADFLTATPNPRNSSSPVNDCSALKPDITINDVTVTEGDTGTKTIDFTVTLSTSSAQTVTVDYATADGTAIAGSDYQSTSGTLTFNPGETSKPITITIIGDTLDELLSETFFVNLTNAQNAVVLDGQGQGTITDNDPAPTISIGDASVAEGDSGTTPADFTVTLSAPSGFTVTVNYATTDGTAHNPGDYQSTSGTLTFNPGETTKTITVLVNGDTTFESNETFVVDLSSASNATIADGQGQGTITNDDAAPPVPAITINDVSVTEGNSGTKTVDFTVSLSTTSTQTVTVAYATANGTAIAGSDYQSTSGTLTFNPGDTSKSITVTINGDTLVEPDETFFVNLSNASANAIISDNQGQGTITNDDAANLVISQVYGGGGNTNAPYTNDFVEIFNHGTTTIDFSVTPYSIQYASASASGTFSASNKTNLTTGTIAPGAYFLVQEASGGGVGVALPTPDASGTIALSATSGKVALVVGTGVLPAFTCPGDDGASPFNPSDSIITDFVGYGGSATTTGHCYEGTGPAPAPDATTADFRKAGGCLDTDQNATDFLISAPNPRNTLSPSNDCSGGLKPEITINDRALSESTTPATFTVTLSTTSTLTVTVDYSTANGTATAGADYTAVSGTLTFAPGETTKTINVPVINDTLDEPNETYFVNLSNALNGTILDSQGQGTINDNDPTPSLTINDVSVSEGDSGTKALDLTVTLSAASGQTVTVDYATADGTATAGSDYQSTSGTLTFNPGQTTQTITVIVNGDTTFEQNETFFVNLTAPINATILDNQGQGTITNDDAAPPTLTIAINDVSVAEGNSGTKTVDFTVSLSTSSAQTVTVAYATSSAAPASGVATAGTDYQSTSGTLTFDPGQTSKSITVTINGDTLVEPDETFFVDLSNPTNATISDPQGVGTITNDDAATIALPTAGQVIINEALIASSTTSTTRPDFLELYNTTSQTLDISGLVISFRPGGTSNTPSTVTLPGAVGSGTTTIAANSYFIIVNGASVLNGSGTAVAADYNPGAGSFDLNGTGGGIKIEINGVKLDGLTYQGSSTAINATFVAYGEGSIFTFTSATTNDLVRSSTSADTNNNASDFRHLSSTTTITPKAVNPP
ncbi:MAG TPA: Calx-beta domain-containing protein [Pyrinomonadaceae bacterium]|nr:Calx-beta domain-containing protein [Pyrinomonadaceae bacterium]